jgi:2-C-methyl-D-erythritol 4-phosphate cytidylyltransferase
VKRNARLIGLIPAAGSGSRIGGQTPKQYVEIGRKPMLAHSIDAVLADARIDEVVVVVAPDDCRHHSLDVGGKVRFMNIGGASRAASVLNGLNALDAEDNDWVLVHDAARPCLSVVDLRALIDALLVDPVGGLLAQPLADTLKRARGDRVEATVPREFLWRAATPQMFRLGALRRALREVADLALITDEANAMERLGHAPRLVAGSATNIKVTTAADWPLAAAILDMQGRLT